MLKRYGNLEIEGILSIIFVTPTTLLVKIIRNFRQKWPQELLTRLQVFEGLVKSWCYKGNTHDVKFDMTTYTTSDITSNMISNTATDMGSHNIWHDIWQELLYIERMHSAMMSTDKFAFKI